MTTDDSAELTTAEAALLAGVSPRTIREWHQQGKVAGRKTSAGLVVERRSLEDHLRRRGEPPGSPSAATGEASAAPAVDLAPLVAALERAHAEALMLAGRVTWLERQLQDRDATILQLTAGAAEPAEAAAEPPAEPPPEAEAGAAAVPPWWVRLGRWWQRGGI